MEGRPAQTPAALGLPAEAVGRSAEEGRRFARRMYVPRTVGIALGALCVGGGLWQEGAPTWVWALLLANAFLWPHLAYLLARGSLDPYRAELNNMTADSAIGGAWVAAIGFNLVPSAVLVAMLAMDKAAVGGLRFLGRCAFAQVVTALAVILATGFPLQLRSELPAVLASMPLLFIYPVLVGQTAYRLARRVAHDNRLLAAMSTIDGLTGLLNRASWERAAENEFSRCRRSNLVSCVLMLDLDHFKAINDRYGHAAGDDVLRAVGAIMRRALRQHDVAGRYGGEEFAILLPGTDAAGAAPLAERLRRRIASAALEPRLGLRATASIGYASLAPLDASHVTWIDRADRALYRAKDAGRNRCAGAPET
jgi:diguanylate cyclase